MMKLTPSNESFEDALNLLIESKESHGSFYLCFVQVLHKLKDHEIASRALNYLLNKLENIKMLNPLEPDVQNTVKLLILVLNHLLMHAGNLKSGRMKRAKTSLEAFVSWPKNIAKMARNVILTCRNEISFPGFEYLRNFSEKSRSPSLILHLKNNSEKQKNDVFVETKPLFYLREDNSKLFNWNRLLELKTFSESEFKSLKFERGFPMQIYIFLILYIINVNVGVTSMDLININWLSFDQINQILNEIVQISISTCKEANGESARIYKIKNLRNYIYRTAFKNKKSQTSVGSSLIKKYPIEFMMEFPEKSHLLVPNSMINSLDNILSTAKGNHKSGEEFVVNIIIFGGDKMINQTIKWHLTCDNKIKYKFYLIPAIESVLSKYLSYNDSIYKENVTLQLEKGIIAQSTNEKQKKSISNKKPSKKTDEQPIIYSKVIENYVDLAHYEAEIDFFNVNIWCSMRGRVYDPDTNCVFYDRFEITGKNKTFKGKLEIEVVDSSGDLKKRVMTNGIIKKIVFEGLKMDKKSEPFMDLDISYSDEIVSLRINKMRFTSYSIDLLRSDSDRLFKVVEVKKLKRSIGGNKTFSVMNFTPILKG